MTNSTPRSRLDRQLRLDLDRDPSHAREDFIVSRSNEAAVAAIDGWPRWPTGKLALVGPAGSGKTHLARSWAASVGAVIAEPGAIEILAAGASPILLEDADRRWEEDSLFHVMNMADSGGGLLITGQTAPSSWPVRLADLRSRLNALTVAQIEPPDDVVLLGVMKKLFSERNIEPKPGVEAYILRRIERSPPAVQDIVRRVDELAGAERREITRALVGRIVQDEEGTLDPTR
ncbi:MAG TPA: chromosomal replication initiator DnaA [Caulobacteraceae bacterium]|nr:chromosomal replication initiator DnaA [Caulobacteraceae bacterium]